MIHPISGLLLPAVTHPRPPQANLRVWHPPQANLNDLLGSDEEQVLFDAGKGDESAFDTEDGNDRSKDEVQPGSDYASTDDNSVAGDVPVQHIKKTLPVFQVRTTSSSMARTSVGWSEQEPRHSRRKPRGIGLEMRV